MKKILITGATGNVGIEVLNSLSKIDHQLTIYAAVRDIEKDKGTLKDFKITLIKFDFEERSTYQPAFENCEVLFLLRPPQLSEVDKIFKPILETAVQCAVKHIIFLSVQGVEKSALIPHHKIEKLVLESKIPYTFLRPAYFMQNFTTTLRHDLVERNRIFLPAGNSKFTLVDVSDIGDVTAKVSIAPYKYTNQAYELTCNEKLTFSQMATELSNLLHTTINYESPILVKFFLVKRKEGIPTMLILVMIMLHYLPRFQKEPVATDSVNSITGHQPNTFSQFIIQNRKKLLK